MSKNWRPEGWNKIRLNAENQLVQNKVPVVPFDDDYFEAGADAMLKAVEQEYALLLFSLDYNEMPVIVKDEQQILIGLELGKSELPVYLSAFTVRGDYVLRSLIITGKPLKEAE